MQRSKVDWLTVTWYPDPSEVLWANIMDLFKVIFGAHVVQGIACPGMLGYQDGIRWYANIDGTEHHLARLDYGGTHHKMRARLDLSGSACALIKDWQTLASWVGQQWQYKITRVDLAVDFLDGEYTVEDAKDWYLAGDFHAGGRQPRHSTPGDWLDPHHGRTLEIGRRTNGKMLRAYEKGRQLGDPNSPWTRFEVELRNIDRDLPTDILTDPDKYFVGAYKCLEPLIASAPERIPTHQAEGDIALETLITYQRQSYGRLITVLRGHLSADAVLDAISRPGVPARLEKSALVGSFPKAAHSPPGVTHASFSHRF
jgi:phage replication initiation protein